MMHIKHICLIEADQFFIHWEGMRIDFNGNTFTEYIYDGGKYSPSIL